MEQSQLPNYMNTYDDAIFTLLTNPGFSFERKWGLPFAVKYHGGTHGGDPENPELKTTLFAAGRGIKKGTVIKEMHSIQVADIIAKLLDLPYEFEISSPHDLLIP